MTSLLRSHRRTTAVLATLGMGAALVLASTQASVAGSAQAPGAHRAAPVASTSLYATTTIKSSSGKKLRVALSAYKGDIASFNISLSTSGEYHSWSFVAPKSAVKINAKGAGTVKLSAKQTGGLGKLKLKLKPTGKFKTSKCGGKVYAKSRSVKTTGPFLFNTKTKAWGKVGKKKGNVGFGSRRVSYYYDVDCPDPEYKNPCTTSLTWSAYKSSPKSYLSISGSKIGKRSTVFASRSTSLKKPKNATRYDQVTKKVKAPALTVSGDDNAKMKVHGTSGSATGTSALPSTPYTSDCDTGTQHRVNWYGSMKNGSPALVVKAQVFGNFKLPNGTSMSFGRAWRTN